jgi:transposase
MLWQIENSFRVLKSTLDLRPVYHWTEKRVYTG